jgi:hypothetical protein
MSPDPGETRLLKTAIIAGGIFNGLVILIASREWFLPLGSSFRDMLGAGLMFMVELISVTFVLRIIYLTLNRDRLSVRGVLYAALALVLSLSLLVTGILVWQYIEAVHHLTPEP